jgi:hypothetical protein
VHNALTSAINSIAELRTRLEILENNQKVLEDNQSFLQTENLQLSQKLSLLETVELHRQQQNNNIQSQSSVPRPTTTTSEERSLSVSAATVKCFAPPQSSSTTAPTATHGNGAITDSIVVRSTVAEGADRPSTVSPTINSDVVVAAQQPLVTRPKGTPVVGLEIAEDNGVEGVLVVSVKPNGPAAMAGLQCNDRILTFSGFRVSTCQNFKYAVSSTAPNQAVEVTYLTPGNVRPMSTTIKMRETTEISSSSPPSVIVLNTVGYTPNNNTLFVDPRMTDFPLRIEMDRPPSVVSYRPCLTDFVQPPVRPAMGYPESMSATRASIFLSANQQPPVAPQRIVY